jgi:FAD/FMN-containing dehydrogenase
MPFVPAEHHGKLVIFGLVCYAGPAVAGERAIAPLRALATPIVDMVRPIAYPEIFPPDDPSYRPTAVGRTMFVDRVDLGTARTIDRYLRASDASVRVAQIRVLGGAASRVPADATAYAHRNSRILVNLAAFYEGPADRAVRQAWVDEFAGALRQSDRGAYVGFLSDERPGGVRAAYPGATWDRLATIKARYDPTNLFRLNQNIPPAGRSASRSVRGRGTVEGAS